MAERVIVGTFDDRDDAAAAIRDLRDAGFAEEQMGVAMRDRRAQEELMDTTGTEAAEGAATGAVSGGIVGGVLGLLAGAGALLVPGVGPVVAAGWLGSTIAGAAVGAAAGGIIGALIGMGLPESEARYFDQRFRGGAALLTVRAGVRSGEAAAIMRDHGGDVGPAATREFLAEDVVAEPWVGERDRRVWDDPAYSGPERRMAYR
ncbi:MAG TPA: general stress protein [Gemmatimonadales bacterium]|nr:general stress protein [Gemmatimonadales bacterium]